MGAFAMTRQFVYSVHDLQSGGHDYESPVPPGWIASAIEGCEFEPFEDEAGELRVSLSMSGRDVLVRGRVKIPVGIHCARCLKPFRVLVDSELALLLVPGRATRPAAVPAGRQKKGAPKAAADKTPVPRPQKHAPKLGFAKGRWSKDGDKDAYEFSHDETDMETYDGDEVVLDEFVRELILLEAPIFPLCSEQCPGIRATPEQPSVRRQPSAGDPRLRPLLKIHKREY
jgi:uncharacterized protein